MKLKTITVQAATLKHPHIVRKLVLAGASPAAWTPDSPKYNLDPKYIAGMATATTYEASKDAFRIALFGDSEPGRKHFEQYWKRLEERTVEPPLLEPLALDPGTKNQIKARIENDLPEKAVWPDRLAEIKIPVLVANGYEDLVLGTKRSVELFERLPNAQLVLYPKSGHGFLWQYPELFADQVNAFLDTAALNAS